MESPDVPDTIPPSKMVETLSVATRAHVLVTLEGKLEAAAHLMTEEERKYAGDVHYCLRSPVIL